METSKHTDYRPALVLGEIGLIHNLAEAGIPVFTGTEIEDNPSLYSRFSDWRIPFSDYRSDKFIDELCEFGKSLDQKPVIYSDDDHAILNIAKNQERLKQHFLFSLPTAEKVEKLLDKQSFCELIEEYDLPAPKSITISSYGDLNEKKVANLPYPCIIKPAYKQAWWNNGFGEKVGDYQKAVKCSSYEELVKKYRQISAVNPRVVVQEFIEGNEDELYSVNMFVNDEGELKGYFIGQKLRTYPLEADEGSYIKTVQDAEMIDKAKTIADKLDLKGLLNIQFKRDGRSGEPILLEIHTRNSVWSYLGTKAGVNLTEMYHRELSGQPASKKKFYEPEITYIFLEKDIKAFFQNLESRKISVPKWIFTYFKRFVPAGFRWNDPLPFFMKIWFFIKRRLNLPSVTEALKLSFQTEKQARIQTRHRLKKQ